MSRHSGLWVSMKCITDLVEFGDSVDLDPDRVKIVLPTAAALELPPDCLNIHLPDTVLGQEARMNNYKWCAALAYTRVNKLNQIIGDSPRAKIGMTWPLESEDVLEFARRLEEILVVEEKRQILKYQIKEEL